MNRERLEKEPAGSGIELHVVSMADLAAGRDHGGWEDPDRIAIMTPETRDAMLANPLSSSAEEPVQIVGTQDNRVIGRVDLVAGRIDADGVEIPCFWGSGLIVPEEFRKTLMGVRLILAMQESHHTVAACGVSRLVFPVFKSLKWVDFEMPRYVLFVHSRPFVERYLRTGRLAGLTTAVVDGALRANLRLLRARHRARCRGLRCEQVAQTAELDDRLEERTQPLAMHRSSRWVNWLLTHSFQADPRAERGLFHIRNELNELVAYFLVKARPVTRRGFRDVLLGSLQDWAIFDPGTVDLQGIILSAIRILRSWNVDAIEVCLPADAAGTRLRPWGFVRVGEHYLLVKASSESPLTRFDYRDARMWRMRPVEGDNFFW